VEEDYAVDTDSLMGRTNKSRVLIKIERTRKVPSSMMLGYGACGRNEEDIVEELEI